MYELKELGKAAELLIVDPDRVESGNIPRSNFCAAEIGSYKAQTLAKRITLAWGLECHYANERFDAEVHLKQTSGDYRTLTVIVGCVDNHLARREIHLAVEKYQGYRSDDAANLWWIDGGNGKFSGQVLIGSNTKRIKPEQHFTGTSICRSLPAPSLVHPDLLEPEKPHSKSELSDGLSCPDRIRLGEQSLNINQRVAVEMSEMLTAMFLTRSLRRFATYFDLETGTSRSLYCTPDHIEATILKRPENPLLVRQLREIAWKLKSKRSTILFVGPNFPELKTLEKEVTQIDLDLPKESEIDESIELQLENLRSSGLAIDLSKETQDALLQSLLGLTAGEISNVIAKAVISCNGLNQESINVILEEKKNVIRGSGSLTYVHPEPANNLGGYKSLRAILERAAYTFSPRAKARHVEPCKGILLVGLPGCGKDLCKRVASSITNRALLDLDFGSIMGEGGGVIGSAAMSIKRALSIAGTIKGILGISEFEKAVSGMKSSNKTDGGETARTISYLLNWMQDNQDVLVFATANDVRELESEQFRIGRFSYIHFVDLPETEDRKEIFRVHMKKRALVAEQFDLEKLVDKSKDFSGAEIEGAVKDGVLEAFIDGDRQAETRDIIKAIENITPTAQMMSEKIEEIRKWARNNIKGVGSRTENTGIAGNRTDRIYEL